MEGTTHSEITHVLVYTVRKIDMNIKKIFHIIPDVGMWISIFLVEPAPKSIKEYVLYKHIMCFPFLEKISRFCYVTSGHWHDVSRF